MQMIVEECCGKIVRGADRMNVTGEMQVELFHGDDLAIAATRGAALDTEHWSEARLSNGNGGAMTDLVESLRETNGGGGLPLTEWCWADRSDHNVLAACAALLKALYPLNGELRLGASVWLNLIIVKAERRRHLTNWLRLHATCNLKI